VLNAENDEVSAGETGKDGRFVTETLPSGQYQVSVSADDYDDGYTFPFVNGPTEQTITLRSQLPGALTIRVVDEFTGQPVGKASVVVYDTSRNMVASGKSTKTGEFRTGVLAEGEYITDVSISGYFPVRSWVWVQGDTRHEIMITPSVAGTLTVTVIDQATAMTIPGATVRVYDQTRVELAWGVTDASGIYTSAVLDPGDRLVMVSAEGYMPSGDVYLRLNGDTPLETWLQPSVPGALRVEVVGWDSYEWISGARIIVRDAVTLEEVARGVTDYFGVYTTPELPGGDYVLRVTADGYAASTQAFRLVGPADRLVLLDPAEPTSPGTITLTLLSLPSGQPVTGASITVIDPDDLLVVATGATDVRGMFVTNQLEAGDYLLRVDADYYYPSESTVIVDGPMEITYGLGLQLTATLSLSPVTADPGGQVIVTGEGFAPSETVRITWAVPGGEVLAEVKATKDGTFSRKVTIPFDAAGMSSIVAEGLESGRLGAWYVIITVSGEPSLTP
jgi:5-hydroxyisourate hydrolase-like protein (transthyretin family)